MKAATRAGQAIALDAIPSLAWDEFRQRIAGAPAQAKRVSALFGRAVGDGVQLVAVVAADARGTIDVATTTLEGDRFPSLTVDCPQVHLFEREIAEEWGVVPEGHPWLKPVRFVRSRRAGKDAWGRDAEHAPVPGVTDFYCVEGDEVHVWPSAPCTPA